MGSLLGLNSVARSKISAGLNLFQTGEDFVVRVYKRSSSDVTIGYAHLVHHGPVCGEASEAAFASGISEQQGSALLFRGGVCPNCA
jgi:hypothetical protein